MNQPIDPSSDPFRGEPLPPSATPEFSNTGESVPPAVAVEAPVPHEVERAVMHALQSHPSLRFSRLNVHQYDRDAVCLEGFLESNDDEIDLSDVVRGIHGIKLVVNRVLMPQPSVPEKG